ncbi:MAG: CAP domain-containing protein [Bacteroidetes bacterium]|nr:CAP domain-containing protein [Bacteroidota bacterium]
MIKNLLLIIFISFSIYASSQTASSEISVNSINYPLIKSEFLNRLNKLRGDQKLNALVSDNILKKAATDQAAYQNGKHLVTHNQTNKGKEKPQSRVFYYNGTHDFVGENCIRIPLKKAFKAKYKKTEIEVKTYADAAEALFLGWKNSPGHYKNMIEPSYDVSGLGFSFDKDSSFLYCTQVFGAKPFVFGIEYVSPPDAYGILESTPSVCQLFETNDARKAMKSLQLVYGDDSIFIRSEEAGLLQKFFNKPNDAIYFDILQRKQFVCEKNNLLHGSGIHDGKMLQPVLFSTIFKRSRIKDGKNLYASICKLPKQLVNNTKNDQLCYGFIKNGYSCQYIYPISVPDENLNMLDLYPKWIYIQNLEIQPDSFKGKLSFTIPFERGEVKLSEQKKKQLKNKLEIYKPFITSVDLQTFSSIEGSTQVNLKIQEQRAANIAEIVKDYSSNPLNFKTQATENWDDFFALIENTEVAYLKKLSKEKIKERLRSAALLDSLDYLLRINRTALLTVGITAYIDNNSNPYLILAAYKKSIEEGDSLKSFANQNKLLEYVTRSQFESRDILPIQIPLTKKFLPHITNYLAVTVKDDELFYSQFARNIALQAAKIDENYLPVKFNLCIISLKYLNIFNDTLIPLPELETKMNECFKLGTYDDSIIVNHMWLNYSILSVYKNWYRHLYHNIDKHLLNVKKYYPGAHISEPEAVKLGLMFNTYARYEWACELLLPYMQNKTKNEDLVFLFVETYASFENGAIPEADWIKYLKKAKKMNPIRFYKWIDEKNYQLLRKPLIKKEFCDIKE